MRARTVAVVAACIGVLGVAGAARAAGAVSATMTEWLGRFGDVLSHVEDRGLATVDPAVAIGGAIDGLLGAVDPEASYIRPDHLEYLRSDGADPRVGAGLRLEAAGGLALVTGLTTDGPADRAGVRPGDYVTVIDGVSIIGLDDTSVAARLRGDVGKTVAVTLMRPDGRLRTVDLVLATPVPAVQIMRVERGYGYVRPTGLNERATEDLTRAIRRLRSENPGMKGLVLDLRNNPGGLLDQVVGMADVFLTEGEVLSQRGREARDIERYHARGVDELGGEPLVILVDGATASGAEAVAAALQDHGRAKVVGMPTFGRGTIQQVIPLGGGQKGALKLTTARLYRMTGRPLSEGVTPDLVVARDAEEATRPRRPGVRAPSDAPVLPPAGYRGDYQLDRAIALLDGGR